ncbi:hypothetical protein [Candidatus Endomicrobiellum trichonymphae]|uniref:hypothetical protein n=1 Tax=Endomicrobium trichonymphae TaxID=1408204 RepID=UPI00086649CE|nr:hypothetical protein [Candidatus Endomicrobium trichonymphae]BAV59169.1 hypothetical protein RSTT_589 [Candidatus Endomicrobium trichonymphae]
MKMRFIFILIMFCLLLMSYTVLDYPKRALGFSIEKFKNEKTGRFYEVFVMLKQQDCFDKSLNIIKDLEAEVVHKSFKNGYIIALNFSNSFDCCLNSTEAGIFITETKTGGVKVEVISNNSLLAKKLSVEFFEKLRA